MKDIFVTLLGFRGQDPEVGDLVALIKDKGNEYDDEAILGRILDEVIEDEKINAQFFAKNSNGKTFYWDNNRIDLNFEPGDDCFFCDEIFDEMSAECYVANSVNTVARGTYSAGRIYDKFEHIALAEILFIVKGMAVCKFMGEPEQKKLA